MPKFTCFASEREAQISLKASRCHAIGTKVVWVDYDCTAREAVQQSAKGDTRFRVFPCDNFKEAKALAKALS